MHFHSWYIKFNTFFIQGTYLDIYLISTTHFKLFHHGRVQSVVNPYNTSQRWTKSGSFFDHFQTVLFGLTTICFRSWWIKFNAFVLISYISRYLPWCTTHFKLLHHERVQSVVNSYNTSQRWSKKWVFFDHFQTVCIRVNYNLHSLMMDQIQSVFHSRYISRMST